MADPSPGHLILTRLHRADQERRETVEAMHRALWEDIAAFWAAQRAREAA
jgi:hypothetical protein